MARLKEYLSFIEDGIMMTLMNVTHEQLKLTTETKLRDKNTSSSQRI